MITAASHKCAAFFLCFVLVTTWQALGFAGAPASRRCHEYIKRKQLKAAGECFTALAAALGPAARLSAEKKYLQGQRLRNAALAFRKAAAQRPKEAVSLRLRALRLLDSYLKDKLCETPARCRTVQGLRQSIYNEIGFTPVAIKTGHPKATFTLQGMGMQHKGKGAFWKGKLAPGSYLLTFTYPDGTTRAKTLQVVPGRAQVVSETPPQSRTKPPKKRPEKRLQKRPIASIPRAPAKRAVVPPVRPSGPKVWPWIIVGVGGALLVGGVVALGVGKSLEQQTHDAIQQQRQVGPSPSLADTTRFNARYDSADAAMITGWIGLGLGSAVAITGLVVALLQPRRATGPDTSADDFGVPGDEPQ